MATILSTPTKRRQQLQPDGLPTPTMCANTLAPNGDSSHRYNTRSRSPSPAAPRSPATELVDGLQSMRLAASPARRPVAAGAGRSPAPDGELSLAEMSLGVLAAAAAAAAAPLVAPPPQSASHSSTGLIYDARCLLHQANYAHVEQPARASTTMALLQSKGLYQRCVHLPTRAALDAEIVGGGAHSRAHLAAIEATAHDAYKEDEADSETEGDATLYPDCKFLDSDTYVNRHSSAVARLAIGGIIELMEAVADGRVKNGFAVIRPPGHHADTVKAQGFCLYNNVAVGVRALRASRPDCRRVLIVDWDVHHGNGTQNIFYSDPDVLYFSIHRYQNGAFYPHTGAHDEVGPLGSAAEGRNINVPLNFKGLGDEDYLAIFHTLLLPVLREFEPDLVVVSAGFDCAQGDPLGGMEVSSEAFGHFTRLLLEAAPDGRVVMALEGGYNVRAVSEAVCACVGALLGDPLEPLPDSSAFMGKRELSKLAARRENFRKDLALCVDVQKKYWRCLREGEQAGAGASVAAGSAAGTPAPAATRSPQPPSSAEKRPSAASTSTTVTVTAPVLASVTIAPPASVAMATAATATSSQSASLASVSVSTPLPSPSPIIGSLAQASPSPAPIALAAGAPSPFSTVGASPSSSPASFDAPAIFVSPPSSVAVRPHASTLVRHDSDVVMQ